MKAEELRIGNLFNEKHSDQIIEVLELKKDCIVFDGKFPYKWQAEPIPITEEWLKKMGFRTSMMQGSYIEYEIQLESGFYISAFGYRESITTTLCDANSNEIGVYSSVHQIQNLYFALTGEELELK